MRFALGFAPMSDLAGKTMFISGASRGIGLAIGKRAAQDGANVCIVAKTAEPHPKLEGTIYTAAEEIEAAGGQALPIVGDVRDEDSVFGRRRAVRREVRRHRHLRQQRLARSTSPAPRQLEMKRYDLMQDINTRGTFLFSKACIPHLKQAENPHVLDAVAAAEHGAERGSRPTSPTRSPSSG